jgi:hypothetical protein
MYHGLDTDLQQPAPIGRYRTYRANAALGVAAILRMNRVACLAQETYKNS